MRQKEKIITKEVNYLTHPKPQFISIVDKGANQTPFNVLKALNKGETVMKTKLKLVRKGNIPTGTRKIVFAKTEFPDVKAVKAYLDKYNWEGYEVTTLKSGDFEAAGADVSDENFKTIKKVAMDNGVTGFVGEVDMDTVEEVEEAVVKDAGKDASSLRGKPGKKEKTAQELAAAAGNKGSGSSDKVGGDDEGDVAGNDMLDDDPEYTALGDEEIATKAGKKAAKKKPANEQQGADTADGSDANDMDEDDGADKAGKGTKKKSLTFKDIQGNDTVRKFDFWNAAMSDDNTLSEVMKDGMRDGVPPGIGEIMQASYTAMANIMKGDEKISAKKKAITKLGNDLAEMSFAIYQAYDEIVDSGVGTKAEKAFVKSVKTFIEEESTETATKTDPALMGLISKMVGTLDTLGKRLATVETTTKKSVDEAVSTIKNTAPSKKARDFDYDDRGDNAGGGRVVTKAQEEETRKNLELDRQLNNNILGRGLYNTH